MRCFDLSEAELTTNAWGPSVACADKMAAASSITVKEDRYGGVELAVVPAALETATAKDGDFARELQAGLEAWQAAGKKGLWLKIPTAAASCVGAAVALGFEFHHAKPGYVLLTRWLPSTPSPLPSYGFTQIGVGGVVVNAAGHVLMVVEKVAPMAQHQGSWKLPGGLADPGEDFAETVAREVREETGVRGVLEGVVSMRHMHGVRFGQGDLYVVVKLRAEEDAITLDPHELLDARWMSRDQIRELVTDPAGGTSLDGKVSTNNWKMIDNALSGTLIMGTSLPNSRPGGQASMLYMAPPRAGL